MQIEFPCNVCCKHIKVDQEAFKNGGTVKCKFCGTLIKFRKKNNREEVKK